uniref:RIMS binding protein 2 n=1 Tax=Oryctolagus cuniculus TaxID=9986 RepID=A0A5F9CAP1_RABIT
MREAADRRQQLELEHEQALAVLSAKQQEIDLLQKVSSGVGGTGTRGGTPPAKPHSPSQASLPQPSLTPPAKPHSVSCTARPSAVSVFWVFLGCL